MKKPGKPARWTALSCFGVFALAGALLGPIMLLTSQADSVDAARPMGIAYKLLRDAFGIHEPDFGVLMLVGALGYGFIGVDVAAGMGLHVEASAR